MENWFLLLTLFFPRLTLLFTWLAGGIPANSTPFFADFIGTWFVPNFLIALWAWESPHVHPVWVVIHVGVGIGRLIREYNYQKRGLDWKAKKN
jgi:hypothetical protein